jgi:simple sugar transport system ATP-binding protein
LTDVPALTPRSPGTTVLELRGITKRFGDFAANDRIDLDVRAGEVHALLGENGAGKSTLMNCLYGLYRPDEGEVVLEGQVQHFTSSADAIRAGIGMVHQHFMLIPVMTVAENIVLAAEPRQGVFLDMAEAERRVRELSERHDLPVDPSAVVEDIGVGMQQRAEILKALYRDARLLVLDEPTAVLTPQEALELFDVLRELRARGTAIILITHKLDEALEIADRVSVLRRGVKVATIPAAGATERGLAELMVGREVLLEVTKTSAHPGAPVLEVNDLHVTDDRELEAVKGISLSVRAGEIVGIAGVDGNGQAQLVEAIAGMRHASGGTILVDGKDISKASPRQANEAGIAHIPEDRQEHGLVLDFTLAENSVLHDYYRPPISTHGFLDLDATEERAKTYITRYDVRGGDPRTPARSLSGGNQQKFILAREIDSDPRLILASQPTRGLDVGAIEFVHRRLIEQRDDGRGILLVSFELDEILSLSDRILVLFEGEIVLERTPATTDANELGLAMTGGVVEPVP